MHARVGDVNVFVVGGEFDAVCEKGGGVSMCIIVLYMRGVGID